MEHGDQQDLSRLSIPQKKVASERRANRTVALVAAFVVTISVALLVKRCATHPAEQAAAPSRSPAESAQTSDRAPSGALNQPAVLNATGYVVAQRKAAVSSKATGRLRELNVEEGDKVTQNQVLAVLENEDLVALVSQAEANVESLEAKSRSAEAERDEATTLLKRILELKNQGVVSASEVDSIVARYNRAIAEEEAVEAAIALAQAQLKKAQVDLEYSYIRAPFDGTVLSKTADVGEIVAPFGSSVNARAAVVTIADMNSLEVEADVSEANVAMIHPGQKATIVLDSFPQTTYQGVVSKIVPTVDRAKATVLTKIRFVTRDDKVIPEMSAKVAFLLTESADTTPTEPGASPAPTSSPPSS